MEPQFVYVVGQPGAGKSTLMARLTEPFERLSWHEHTVPHDQLLHPETGAIVGAEIGKRRELFSGTDALASAIIDKAAPWIVNTPYPLVLAEGARLANRRFMDAVLLGGYQLTLVLLDHDDADTWRLQRSKLIGRVQNQGWVTGRRTASVNVANYVAKVGQQHDNARVISGHPDAVFEKLTPIVWSSLAVNTA